MRVRTRYEGEAPGDWSDTRTFSVAAGTGLDQLASLDCSSPVGELFELICLAEEAGGALVLPSEGSKLFLKGQINDLSNSAIVSIFTDTIEITQSDDVYCPLPTFTSSKFGHSASLTMPSFNLCDKLEEISDDLNEITAWQDALSVVIGVLGLILAIAWFRKFVEG